MTNIIPKEILKIVNKFVISNYKFFDGGEILEVYDAVGNDDGTYAVDLSLDFDTETFTPSVRAYHIFKNYELIHTHYPSRGDADERVSYFFGKGFEEKVSGELKNEYETGCHA